MPGPGGRQLPVRTGTFGQALGTEAVLQPHQASGGGDPVQDRIIQQGLDDLQSGWANDLGLGQQAVPVLDQTRHLFRGQVVQLSVALADLGSSSRVWTTCRVAGPTIWASASKLSRSWIRPGTFSGGRWSS